jgi:hypothetical protein
VGQFELQTQIPFRNDNKKSKGKDLTDHYGAAGFLILASESRTLSKFGEVAGSPVLQGLSGC